jgi:hypothetical protein
MVHKDIDLVSRIAALREDRQKHAEAIFKIDGTLRKISEMLSAMRIAAQRGNGSQAKAQDAGAPFRGTNAAGLTSERPRKYRKLGLTAAEFVLELLRVHGSATTLEINRAWRAEGRGGVANNTVGRLLGEGLILREPLEGQRGSRYRLNPNAHAAGDSSQS